MDKRKSHSGTERRIHVTEAVAGKPACGASSTHVSTDWNAVSCRTCLGWEGSEFLPHLPAGRPDSARQQRIDNLRLQSTIDRAAVGKDV